MAPPERAGGRVLFAAVVAALMFASWPALESSLGSLRELGASALGAVQFMGLLLVFLTGYSAKQRSRRGGGSGPGEGPPHD